MSESVAVGPNVQVSHEVDGRILTGVGVSQDNLAETMDRHTEAEPVAETPAPTQARTDTGQFQKQTRGQRRFDELTREREEARREAAEAKRERDELRARLSAPAEQRQPEPPSRPSAVPSAADARSKPIEDEIGTKYQSYADFSEDLADWKVEQRLGTFDIDARVRQGIEADRATRHFADTVSGVFTKARQSYPDFDAVIAQGPGSQIDFGKQRRDWLVSRPDADHVLYAIAKDGAFASRLASMTDIDFGIAVSQLSQAAASPASAPRESSVPAPYSPVGSGSRTASVPLSEMPKKAGYDFDASGYREKRARELGRKR
jgi:hypothetical protein